MLAIMAMLSKLVGADVDPSVLKNTKEGMSRIVSLQNLRKIEKWNANIPQSEKIQLSKLVIRESLNNILNQPAICDLGFASRFDELALKYNLIQSSKELPTFLMFLRTQNLIDDLLLKNLLRSSELNKKLKSLDLNNKIMPVLGRKDFDEKNLDLKNLYSSFVTWPDEKKNCSLGKFFALSAQLEWKKKKERNQILKEANYFAFKDKIISREIYHRLELLRTSDALDWGIYLKNYLDVSLNAKDKLKLIEKPDSGPTIKKAEYINRREKLTRRGKLYTYYNSTQVMMLADVLQKTIRRMDAQRAFIQFDFENTSDNHPESEIYVLSPMERYRLSIKLLRKDLGELMRSELFLNTPVEYADIVAASYETGIITTEELDLILKFEEFWNPKDPKWKIYTNFTLSILGTASFYLPPPWNIIGAIALVVTQVQLNKNAQKPDPDDNWNVVI
jgi:hypothetical protein